mmetsp:Transcript_10572/g.19073  ORF Transcript_10572/g.19073 Transcript_10572/m.19073 type:complete len:154 (+) Transcript_10572:26-487(+)
MKGRKFGGDAGGSSRASGNVEFEKNGPDFYRTLQKHTKVDVKLDSDGSARHSSGKKEAKCTDNINENDLHGLITQGYDVGIQLDDRDLGVENRIVDGTREKNEMKVFQRISKVGKMNKRQNRNQQQIKANPVASSHSNSLTLSFQEHDDDDNE